MFLDYRKTHSIVPSVQDHIHGAGLHVGSNSMYQNQDISHFYLFEADRNFWSS